jgi:hypothetical protein
VSAFPHETAAKSAESASMQTARPPLSSPDVETGDEHGRASSPGKWKPALNLDSQPRSTNLTADKTANLAARTYRFGLAALGCLSFALGAIGAVVPGLPTTVFLLIGSYFFTRSCPWLEERLLNTRLLRPYAAVIRSQAPLSPRVRLGILAVVWLSIGVSLGMLAWREMWVAAGLTLASGLVATVVIWRFRREKVAA